MAERTRAVILKLPELNRTKFHVHLAGLDLGKIENIVNERQQIRSGRVNGLREFHLLGKQVFLGIFGQHFRQNQQVVERRSQLVAHVGQEFALVLGGERKLFGLFFQLLLGLLDFAILRLHFGFLFREELRLFLQLGVGRLQLQLLALQFFRQCLRLLQQFFGTHRSGDGV